MDTTGYGNPVETQNTSSSQKKNTEDKESKKTKTKKTEEANGELDLDRDMI